MLRLWCTSIGEIKEVKMLVCILYSIMLTGLALCGSYATWVLAFELVFPEPITGLSKGIFLFLAVVLSPLGFCDAMWNVWGEQKEGK